MTDKPELCLKAGDWVEYRGAVYLVECVIDDEAVLTDSDGKELYVPLEQVGKVNP